MLTINLKTILWDQPACVRRNGCDLSIFFKDLNNKPILLFLKLIKTKAKIDSCCLRDCVHDVDGFDTEQDDQTIPNLIRKRNYTLYVLILTVYIYNLLNSIVCMMINFVIDHNILDSH